MEPLIEPCISNTILWVLPAYEVSLHQPQQRTVDFNGQLVKTHVHLQRERSIIIRRVPLLELRDVNVDLGKRGTVSFRLSGGNCLELYLQV